MIPGQEDPQEFEALLRDVCDEWRAVGPTEMSLVIEIAIAQWRLRRAQRAELGQIRQGIFDATNAPTPDFVKEIGADPPSPNLREILRKRIEQLEAVLVGVILEVNSEGTVSEYNCDLLDKVFGPSEYNPAPKLRRWFLDETTDSLSEEFMEDTPLPEGSKPNKRGDAFVELVMCSRRLRT